MIVYAETSFLFSLLAFDANSDRAVALRATFTAPLLLSSLSRLELSNAISLARFQGRVDRAGAQRIRRRIAEDFASGLFVELAADWPSVYRAADTLAQRYTELIGTRSLDILQVAAALFLEADEFWTFDRRQSSLARSVGLIVRPVSATDAPPFVLEGEEI